MCDDDARYFARSVAEGGRLRIARLTFAQLVARLVAAAHMSPAAKVVAIHHWYHHTASAEEPNAVRIGLQHLSFQPLLVTLPHPVPTGLALRWAFCEDEEFSLRLVQTYGSEAIVKLRYLLAKFDVGHKEGGLQGFGHQGMQSAKKRQAQDAAAAMAAEPQYFEWVTTSTVEGRLAGPRVRLRKDVMAGASEAVPRMGKEIEQQVRRSAK